MGATQIIGWDGVLPGIGIQVLFQQGLSNGGVSLYTACLIGNLLSTGSLASVSGGGVDGYYFGPDTQIALNNEQDAINLFGAGSELHRGYRAFVKVNPNVSLYAAPVLESSGSKASLVITLSGTPTSNGTVRFWIGQENVDVGFAQTQATYFNGTSWVTQTGGDSVTTIAETAAALINANVNLPVTATSSSGVVTITAKQKGLRGNWLRGSAVIVNGTGITSNTTKQIFFTGGTTADSNTNVLNFLATLGRRFYYNVSAAEDSTQFVALANQLSQQAPAVPGLRMRAMAGSVDTLGNVSSIGTTANNSRAEITWLQNGDVTPFEMAAKATAGYMLMEVPPLTAQFSVNFDYWGNTADSQGLWDVKAPRDGSAPSRNTLKAAVLSGITPVQLNAVGGGTNITKRVTTRTLNGSVNDYRVADASRVTICDVFADELGNKLGASYQRCVIANDPPQGANRQPPPGVVYPALVKPSVLKSIDNYNNNGVLNNATLIKAETVVQIDTLNPSRITIQVPIRTAVPLHQIGLSVEEVSSF